MRGLGSGVRFFMVVMIGLVMMLFELFIDFFLRLFVSVVLRFGVFDIGFRLFEEGMCVRDCWGDVRLMGF